MAGTGTQGSITRGTWNMANMVRAIQQLDLKLFFRLYSLNRHSQVPRLAKAVSRTGDGWLYLLIMPLSIYQLKPEMLRELVTLGLLGFGLERVLYYVLKNVFRRQRPEEYLPNFSAIIAPSDRFSMPSGHTSAAFFAATFMVFGVSMAFIPLYLYGIFVGLSRMVLGVHFPSDLLGGAALGTTIALLIL